MSAELEAAADDVCASCSKAEVDNIKLKLCTACKLVKYCSVECQKNHRKQHKKACKKRLAEMRDGIIFTQPDESHLGECPICCLPLPIDTSKSSIMSCCCKRICLGCGFANAKREFEQGLEQRCAYCREVVPKTEEECIKNYMERAKVNDPIALFQMGGNCRDEGDYKGAVEYFKMAAELGNMDAHFNISSFYANGEGVEKNEKRELYHFEEAAIGGHPLARLNLGYLEQEKGRIDRAMNHYIIAAKLGYDDALHNVKLGFTDGFVSKEDYEAALRGHQAAVDATKSQQRDAAAEYYKRQNQE